MVVLGGNDYVKKVAIFDPLESLNLFHSRSNFNVVLCGGEGSISIFPDLDEMSVVFSFPGIATFLSVPVKGGEFDFSRVRYGKEIYLSRSLSDIVVKKSGPITLSIVGGINFSSNSYFNLGKLLGGREESSRAFQVAKGRVEEMSSKEGVTGKIAQAVTPYFVNMDSLSSFLSSNPTSGPLALSFSYNKDLYDVFLYDFPRDVTQSVYVVDALVSNFVLSKTSPVYSEVRRRLSSELEELVSKKEVYEEVSKLSSDHFSSLMKSSGGMVVAFDYMVNHLSFKDFENKHHIDLHFFDVHMDKYAYELYSEGKEEYRNIDINPGGDFFRANKIFYSDIRSPSLIDDIRLLVLTLPVVIYVNSNNSSLVALLFVLVPVFSSSHSRYEVLDITSYYKPLKSTAYFSIIKSQPEKNEKKKKVVLSLDYETVLSSYVDKYNEVEHGKKRFSVEGYIDEDGKFVLEVNPHQSGPEEVREALLLRRLVPEEGLASLLLDTYTRISLDRYLRSSGLCVPVSETERNFVYPPREGLDEELLPNLVKVIRELGRDYYSYNRSQYLFTSLTDMASESDLCEAIREGAFTVVHQGVRISVKIRTEDKGKHGSRRLSWSSKEKYMISGLEVYRNQDMTVLFGGGKSQG